MAGNAANQAPTFDSEFDTLDVSGRGQWTPNMPWATADGRNQDDPSEAGFYVNPNFAPLASASPFSVTNGVLDLATKPVPAGLDPSLVAGKPYVSGLLQTAKGFSQLYGYFEMRAELPAGNGVGAAFWLLPTDGSWPPELDVMESLGQDPSTVYQTVHGGTSFASVPQQQVAATVAGGAASGFHTYGVDWEADKTTFYVDGKQTGQFDTPASMHKPMYMILSDNSTPASDVKWGKPVDGSTKFPADFKVDYVRALRLHAGPVIRRLPGFRRGSGEHDGWQRHGVEWHGRERVGHGELRPEPACPAHGVRAAGCRLGGGHAGAQPVRGRLRG